MTKTISGNAPQSLQAFQINKIGLADGSTSQQVLILAGGMHVTISQKQASQYAPVVGDYYVVPSEGHPFCAPKSTFLQNYTVGS